MSTTSNYAINGAVRRVDLYVQGLFNFGSNEIQRMNQTLSVEKGGQVCAGIVKLAQKALNTLMNYSIFYDLDWGTSFSTMMLAGNSAVIQRDFKMFMMAALNGVVQQIQEQETGLEPPDERIRNFTLINWSLSLGYLSLSLSLVSAADTVITIVVPIPIVP